MKYNIGDKVSVTATITGYEVRKHYKTGEIETRYTAEYGTKEDSDGYLDAIYAKEEDLNPL